MDPLSVVASIIAVLQLTNKVIGYLNDVNDASRERARCAVETSNLYSLLTNLRFRLEDGHVNEPWFVAVRALAIEHGPLDQFKDTLEMLQDRMTQGRGRLGQLTDSLTWKFKKVEVDRMLQSIERLKSLVSIALQMDHLKLSQAIKHDTGLLRTDIATLGAGIESMRLEHDRTHLEKLRKWVSQSDFTTQQSDIFRQRHEGTGQWFLSTTEFSDWLSPSKPGATILCTGIPGAGKTMIAAVAIDHILTKLRRSTVAVVFLYCSYKSRSEQSIETLLAAILQQLVQPSCPKVGKIVADLHEQHIAQGSRPSAEELRQRLMVAFAEFSSVYIVIDALDECSADDGTRGRLLKYLQELRSATDVRVLITSRHLPDIVQEFADVPRVEIRAHDKDVRLFLAGELHRLPRCIQRDAELQRLVQDQIVGAIDGMFLLARLYVDSLMDKRTKSKVQSTLAELSGGAHMLEKAYGDAVARLKSQLPGDSALAMRVLTYLVYAESALTTTELCHALAVEPGQGSLDIDNVLDPQDIVAVCAGLVAIDQESDIIRLVHYTTYEYFETVRADMGPHSQLDIAHTCLTYLALDVFRSGSCSTDAEFERRLHDYPFLDYAALHWGAHALTVQADVFDLACTVLLDDNLTSAMIQAAAAPLHRHSRGKYSHYFPQGRIGLHVAAELGLCDIAEKMFTAFPDKVETWLAAKDIKGRTPLYVAAVHDQESMLRLLLDRGANPNIHGGDFDYPLIAAVLSKHEEAAKLLLERGADPNLASGEFGTALQTAFREGHRSLVRTLIDGGAHVPDAETYKLSPLHMASTNGWHDVVQSLLDHRTTESLAQVDSRGWTLLYGASAFNQVELVQALVNKGVHVDSPEASNRNPIQVAAEGGHLDIVKILLKHEARIDSSDKRGLSPLHRAAYMGHLQVAKLLIDEGALLDARERHGLTPFDGAASNGQFPMLEILLEYGADINTRDNDQSTPLDRACYSGDLPLVRFLLDAGADLSLVNKYGATPVYVASSHGHVEIVEALLAHGADISIPNHLGWYPVTMAAEQSHVDVVKLLLPLIADVNTIESSHESLVSILTRRGQRSLLQSARDHHHADVHSTGFHGRNLLHVAIRRAQLDIFSYLRRLGLQTDATDAMGDGLLRAAASSGDLETCDFILDLLPLPAQRTNYWSPLHWACRNWNAHVIERLVRAGVSSNIVKTSSSPDAWSPIDIAVFHGHADLLDELSNTAKEGLGARANTCPSGVYQNGFLCDGCDHSIKGTRYKCQTCLDFDYCFMCKPFLDHLHEGHGWDHIESPTGPIQWIE